MAISAGSPSAARLATLVFFGIVGCPDTNETVATAEESSSSGEADTGTTATTTSPTTSASSDPTSSSGSVDSTDESTSTTSDATESSSSSEGSSSESTGGDGCDVADDCPPSDDPCRTAACIDSVCDTLPANDGADCDDGLFCTTADVCSAGTCVAGAPLVCDAPDACNDAVCDEDSQACVPVPANEGGSCDDGDACSIDDVCSSGSCAPGPGLDCSFLDGGCVVGVCVEGLGCQEQAADEGLPCDDGLFCTVADSCMSGSCTGAPNDCAPPDDPCMIGVCDELAQGCISLPGNDGAVCDDGELCTGGETCSGGACSGGAPANEGAACDDDDGCTIGTTCASGVCTDPTDEILACVTDDACCPGGCAAGTDGDCLYWQSGVQQNVPDAALVGWSQCHTETYADSGAALPTVLSSCDGANLLLACRPVGAASWTLLAMAPRADVLFECGFAQNCTMQSNGVGWYYSDSYSWGFAPGGQAVNRNSCDYNDGGQTVPEQRLCWHTGDGTFNSGYRCGSNDLNGDGGWERAIFEAD